MITSIIDKHALRRALSECGVSANAASEAADCERGYVRDLLRGKIREPGAAKLHRLAAVLGVFPDDLLVASAGPDLTSVPDASFPTAPDPAAFAEALYEEVWGPGSGGLVHVNREQVLPNTLVGGDLVVPAQHEIEVYKNSSGAVVLKMDAGGLYDEDQVVVIRPEHVDAVVAAMVRVKAEVMA